jgi:DNA-binding MarR family transcriptional regulator
VGALGTKAKSSTKKADFVDSALISAISHPIRIHCLTTLFERVASPSELAEELDIPVQNVAYHIRELKKLGCIELVRVEKHRSTEHFYRVTKRPYLDAAGLENATPDERAAITANILRLIADDLNLAMAHGTIDDDDNHISRVPMTVDQMGWGEVVALLKETLDRLLGIGVKSAQRTADGESDPDDVIPIKVEIIHFRSPTRA